MFKFPSHFDKNEWFVMISITVLLLIMKRVHRLIPRGMAISIFLYFAVHGLTADTLIGADYPFDFYMIMDTQKLEVFDILIYGLNYPIYGYFFSHFIYKWQLHEVKLCLFIIYWSAQCTLIEWISVKFNVFTYANGWNLGYSALAYLATFILSTIIIKIMMHYWGVQKS